MFFFFKNFFKYNRYTVTYSGKRTTLVINSNNIQFANKTIYYDDIERYGAQNKKYEFIVTDGTHYTLMTSRARDIDKKIYNNCVKLTNNSIPLGIVVDGATRYETNNQNTNSGNDSIPYALML